MKTYLVPSLNLFKSMIVQSNGLNPKLEYTRKIKPGDVVSVEIKREKYSIVIPTDDEYDTMYVYSWKKNNSMRKEICTITLNNGDNIGKRISYFSDKAYVEFDYVRGYSYYCDYKYGYNGSGGLQKHIPKRIYSNMPLTCTIRGTEDDSVVYEYIYESVYTNKDKKYKK